MEVGDLTIRVRYRRRCSPDAASKIAVVDRKLRLPDMPQGMTSESGRRAVPSGRHEQDPHALGEPSDDVATEVPTLTTSGQESCAVVLLLVGVDL